MSIKEAHLRQIGHLNEIRALFENAGIDFGKSGIKWIKRKSWGDEDNKIRVARSSIGLAFSISLYSHDTHPIYILSR